MNTIRILWLTLMIIMAAVPALRAQVKADTLISQSSGARLKTTDSRFGNLIVPNFQSSLQGKAAGVQVIQANGQPASDVVVRIRGTASIYGESQPLYIIDGIPVYAGPREHEVKGVGAGWGSVFNPLADLDQSDIYSIEILKDAAATAMYGSRGANGVIIVNTRKIPENKTNIRIDHYQGVTKPTKRVEGLNSLQYLEQLDRAWQNNGGTGEAPLPTGSGLSRAQAAGINTNQLDQVLDAGRIEQLNASASYGSGKTSFFLSGAYHKEQGIVSGNDLTRYSGRMRISNQISRRLTLGVTAAMNYINYFNMPTGYSPGGGFNAGQLNLPVYPLYNANGTFFFPLNPAVYDLPGSNTASFQSRNDFDNRETTRRLTIGARMDYQIIPGLSFSTDAALEKYFHTQANYLSKRLRNGSLNSGIGRAGVPTAYNGYEKYSNDLYNIKTALTYTKSIRAHQFQALAGTEYIHNENPYFFAEGEGYASEASRQPATANYKNNLTAEALIANTYTFAGYFASGNYSYKGKYKFSGVVRVDGSSRFGANNKYIPFAAGSAAWLLSNEDFLKSATIISLLNLRLSYGSSGNAGIGNYSSLERWETNGNSTYLQQAGIQLAGLGGRDLKPERVTQINLGVDFGLWKNRITGSLDVYDKVTRDMLLSYQAPLSAGVADPALLLNAGSLRNRGIELSLSARISTGLLRWETELNVAHNQNKVLDLGGLSPDQVSSHPNIATYEGHPIGVFYLAAYAGVDPSTGQELIIDQQGNKVPAISAAQIDAARKPIFDKPSAPKLFGGLSNTFSYRNFDLSALLTFSYGNYVLDEGERVLSYLSGTHNLRAAAAGSWTAGSPDLDFPRLKYDDPIAGSNTTRFLHDASYLRMKNLAVGYSFKKAIKNLKFLQSARVYISAQNLFTITGFPGWDPEVAGNYRSNIDRSLNQGITYMDVPQLRVFAAGLNLNF